MDWPRRSVDERLNTVLLGLRCVLLARNELLLPASCRLCLLIIEPVASRDCARVSQGWDVINKHIGKMPLNYRMRPDSTHIHCTGTSFKR
jgi:hypothetical protein